MKKAIVTAMTIADYAALVYINSIIHSKLSRINPSPDRQWAKKGN